MVVKNRGDGGVEVGVVFGHADDDDDDDDYDYGGEEEDSDNSGYDSGDMSEIS